jgi:hypothetical protein
MSFGDAAKNISYKLVDLQILLYDGSLLLMNVFLSSVYLFFMVKLGSDPFVTIMSMKVDVRAYIMNSDNLGQ